MPVIQNWDDAEALLHHCMYNELTVAPEEHPIMMILPSPPFTPRSSKEKLTQIMFETFSVPGFYLGDSSVLSLIGTGRANGLVIDSGLGNTYIVPVYEATSLPDACLSSDLAGQYLNERLLRLMPKSTQDNFTPSNTKSLLEDIKVKGCYVPLDFKSEMNTKDPNREFRYELPDGSYVSLKDERFLAPEIIFQPSLDGFEDAGLAELACQSIGKCDPDLRHELFQNILLTGGTTLLYGYPERLKREIGMLRESQPFKVIAPPERGCLAWIGGSILTSLSSFESAWITKDEYDEEGPLIVNRKC